MRVSLEAARRVWFHQQGLAAPQRGVVETVERTGWIRSLGGIDPYLAIAARVDAGRAEVDAAVASRDLQVLPAVRGCMYLVPRRDAGLVLGVAGADFEKRLARDLARVDAKREEVARVGEAALATLREKGPLTPDALRRTMPAGSVRSLGEPGKKAGMSSLLPGALRALEFAGAVERRAEGDRLDTERYQWAVAGPTVRLDPPDPTSRLAAIARRYLEFIGIGALRPFVDWAGCTQTEARRALATLPLVALEVDGWGPAFALPDQPLDAPAVDGVALLPFEDNAWALLGGPAPWVAAEDAGHQVELWGQRGRIALRDAVHLAHRGALTSRWFLGFWEFDLDAGGIALDAYHPDRPSPRAVEAAWRIARECGHAASFSLDTDDEVRRRAKEIRASCA